MPGRPRKPTKILEIRGTAQPCRMEARAGEPDVQGPFPEPPEWMQGEALKEWERVRQISAYAACVKAPDRGILTGYCVIWADLAKNGDLSASKWQAFIALCTRLGMTPIERSKLKSPQAAPAAEDPWANVGNR